MTDDNVVDLAGTLADQARADDEFLRLELAASAAAATEIPDLAGYALIAWDSEGRPHTFVNLGAATNPTVPRALIPAYIQTVMQHWYALCCDLSGGAA